MDIISYIFMFIFVILPLYAIPMIIIGFSIESDGLEFVNPVWLYKRLQVNWFGAFFIALLFNLLTAPYAVIYWFYKICTVGRND